MKGLDLSRRFYFQCVKPIIAERLPELSDNYAAGLIGYGSDVIGNDDELSRDHEWGPRCHLFLNEVKHKELSTELDNILRDNLPLEFSGFLTRFTLTDKMSIPTKDEFGYHHIVITTPKRFLELTIGKQGIPESDFEWLGISEQRLLEFTAGEVFEDYIGELTSLRKSLAYFPEDVWRFRLAFTLESLGWEDDLISQCGQRNDSISMYLNTSKTVERIMRLVFQLNKKYAPLYPKWLHREFHKLPEIAKDIEGELLGMLEARDYHQKTEALNRIYERLLMIMESQNICKSYPRKFRRSSSGVRFDIQSSAKDVLSTIQGELKDVLINDMPLGAVDQWMLNEDIMLSAEHMKSLMSVYETDVPKRNKLGDLMI